MAAKMLIPLKRCSQVEQLQPYLEQVAQPGMKLVFLVKESRGFSAFMNQLAAIHTGIPPTLAPNADYLMKARARAVEQQIFSACTKLRGRGVEIGINFYAGPVRVAVRRYLKTQDPHLVMILPRTLRKIASLSRLLKSPVLPPVLLIIQPNTAE